VDNSAVSVKSIQQPDYVTKFLDGSVRVALNLGTVVLGHGSYRPGWQWSVHARPVTGHTSRRHVGYVLSGRMAVRSADGVEVEVGPDQAFAAEAGHDAWVVGDETCVALDWWPI
jgi:mannose-6-phosphate isomerase-like protein (cupin superfamily)